MSPGTQLILGCAGLSILISYAWWVKVRTWMLRQELFEIRDWLWDCMRRGDKLNDPGYQQVRHSINAMIRLAPLLTFVSMAKLLVDGVEQRSTKLHGVPEVDVASKKVAEVFAYHLLYRSFAGLAILVLVRLFRFRKSSVVEQFAKWVGRVMNSKEIVVVDGCLA